MTKIDCFRCKYYHVTWDQAQPRGCKVYGFKSARLPSMVVQETSGQDCSFFTLKGENKMPDATKIDLSSKKNW